ncbi:ABC transporter substrate-binding protein [Streptomyces sp. 3N207]|uniref:ABC transporter substrate-binding protein n=1 Tax=Streptomyces sp. 3N207 TaxID=3457417 RepID=UPI003FCFCCB6
MAGLLAGTAACGSSDPTGQAAPPAAKKDQKLHDLLPDKVKKSGTLAVAAGDDYPPLVLLGSDNKTLVGMEPSLMKAISQVLGVKVKFVKANFDSIIGGVQSRRYDLAIQAMLDKPDRQKQVTFVDYFKTSSSILVGQKNAGKVNGLNDLCGKSVAVEQGTAQADDAELQKKKCSKAGKRPVKVLIFPDSVGCFQALSTKRADAFVGGSPTVAYQAKKSNGQMKQAGKPYRFLPYGILVNKEDSSLAKAVQQALQKLIGNGTYSKILKQWDVESGALDRATLNGGTS